LALKPVRRVTIREAARRMLLAGRDATFLNIEGRPYTAGCIRTYETVFRLHVIPLAGEWSVSNVTNRDVQRLLDELTGRTTQANREKVVTVLSRLFEYAWLQRLCDERNPCRGVVLRRDRSSAGRGLAREQQRTILTIASEHDLEHGWSLMLPFTRLALTALLRKGELIPLIYDDHEGLSLEGMRVTVSRCMRVEWTERANWKMAPQIAKGAKTKASLATIPLGLDTCEILSAHRQITGAAEGDLVFPDPVTGGLLGRKRFRDAWHEIRRRAGLDGLRPHDLRHSYGSSLLAMNMNVVEVRRRMRHANASTTLDTYMHEIREEPTDDWYDDWLRTQPGPC
jgi:integrase